MREFITSEAGFSKTDQKLELLEIVKLKPPWVALYRDQEVLFHRIKCAAHFASRLRGLMFYQAYPDFDGLLLIPCHGVHMFWMKFALDLVYLDLSGRILTTVSNFAPNRIGPELKESMAVLELPAGTIANYQLQKGENLEIKRSEAE